MGRAWAVVGCCLVVAGCGGDCLVPGGCGRDGSAGGGSSSFRPAATAGQPLVVYSVTGTATSASVTYASADGSTQQTTVTLPWQFERTAVDRAFLYVSAQNDGETGSVTATITVDGQLLRTATSSAAYGIATASGSCC